MAYVCDNCGKTSVSGRSQRHGRGVAGKRWKRRAQVTLKTFKPNLQKVAIMVNAKKVSLRLCAKCIKRFKREGRIISYTSSKVG